MAALLRCIQDRMGHLKTCRKAGMRDDIYKKLINEQGTFILNSIRNYPHIIPMETARAIIDSVVEDTEIFELKTRLLIVESVNTKTNMSFTNIEISHSTTPSTTVSVCACVFVCACVLAYMRVRSLS